MNRKLIFDAVRDILGRGFVPREIGQLDRAIDAAVQEAGAQLAKESKPTRATDMIDIDLLKVAASHLSEGALAPWVEPIREACERFEINNIRRVSAFITTLAHEGGFKVGVRENMNYSAERMAQVWPSRFRGPNPLPRKLHRNPEAIANEVYANRMGNGPPESGDGWCYRGNGPIQLTGKNNHAAFAKAMGMGVEAAAEWIGSIEGGVMSAAWFWDTNGINALADTPGITDETKRINGGTIGIADRKAIFDRLVSEMLKRERGQ